MQIGRTTRTTHHRPPEPCRRIAIELAALAAVPRLQRKHYETIPKSLTEMDFWVNFFTHLTVIVREAKPELLAGEPLDWKGVDGSDGPNSFDAVWAELPAEKLPADAADEPAAPPSDDDTTAEPPPEASGSPRARVLGLPASAQPKLRERFLRLL